MRRIGLILLLSFLASFAYPYAATDTILINSSTFNFELEKVQLAIGDDLNLKQIEDQNFEETTLPIFIKSSAITREYLRYSGDTPVEIILEPEGFHYIDVYLENLRSGNILKELKVYKE